MSVDKSLDRPGNVWEEPRRLERAVTRRSFLKYSALAAVPFFIPRRDPFSVLPAPESARADNPSAENAPVADADPPPKPLGRIATWSMPVREEPTARSAVVVHKRRDDVIPLEAAVEGDPPWPTNPTWYRTEEGYIHSGYVQPVQDDLQPVVERVPETGFWAQVTVPWTEARWTPQSVGRAFKFYYGTVYRVIELVYDDDGRAWYRLKEGVTPWRPGPYVLAETLQRIPPEALAPISPGRPDKRLVLDLQEQTLRCMEGDQTIFSARCATGGAGSRTPRGEFRVTYNRHTRRMRMEDIPNPYDLPGVPFAVYFTWRGHAIHGTYWHNDYGRPQSNGCVNLTPDDARYLFRWVEPNVPYEEYTTFARPAEAGTPVSVV